ncbi:hypothetical protein H4R19_000565 [Coemansia spiralis]|nr:hypothetical protein H4R19_000565 [Coemansia spiralis]
MRDTLKLIIKDNWLPVVSESITCTTLTHLKINGRTSTSAMLTFIKRMPRLLDLMLNSLYISDIQADISIPEADEGAIIEPLSTSLMVLTVNYDREWHSSDMPVSVVKHMLLGLPTLFKLSSWMIPERPVREFVEAYAPRYPHLREVELELAKDKCNAPDVVPGDLSDSAVQG